MVPREITPKPDREIARGSERHVYAIKKAPDLLLKVLKSKHLRDLSQTDDRRFLGWLKVRQAYALYRREQRAWTNAMLRAAIRKALPPLAGVGDFVLTPTGLGQLVERVSAPDGGTAPTLDDLVQSGPLAPHHLDALNDFVAALYDWHIPAYDLGPKNIIWQETRKRFVLVDGFGDRAVVPIVTWIKAANDWKLDRSFEKTAARAPLIWDRKLRRFSNAAPGQPAP